MHNKIHCKDCFHWQVSGIRRKKYIGECRRYAPSPELETWWNFEKVLWPLTKEDDWCAKAVRNL